MARTCLFFFLLSFCLKSLACPENSPLGARSAAMADASVCLYDVWCTQNNQAGLAFLRSPETAFAIKIPLLINELKIAGLAIAWPVHSGCFGLNISSYGYDLYSENKYGLSFAKAFGKYFSTGVQLDYLNTQIAEGYGSSGRFMAEAGIQGRIAKGLMLAAHIYNPTRTLLSVYSAERIPTTFRMGLAYTCSERVMLCLESEKDSWHSPIFKAALEYRPRKEIYIRTGASDNPSIMAFGFGFLIADLRMDFSSSWNPLLGFTPSFSLSYLFAKKKEYE